MRKLTRHTEHCKFQIFEEKLEKKTMSAKKNLGVPKKNWGSQNLV